MAAEKTPTKYTCDFCHVQLTTTWNKEFADSKHLTRGVSISVTRVPGGGRETMLGMQSWQTHLTDSRSWEDSDNHLCLKCFKNLAIIYRRYERRSESVDIPEFDEMGPPLFTQLKINKVN